MRLSALGIDRAIAFTLLNRSWALFAGPMTLVFILRDLTPAEQGYYYTFNGVLGLQVFFELGLGFVVLQTASHLMATLRIENGRLVGDSVALGRLGRLLCDVLWRFAALSTLFIALVSLGGYGFLARGGAVEAVDWQRAWLLTVPVFGCSILSNMVFSFLEGLGLVQDVALGRLVQSICAMLGLWLALSLGLKLMALLVLHSLNLLVALCWILMRHRGLLRQLLADRAGPGAIDWRHEIWPFQWRIAISWSAGYFGSQALTPIVFQSLGAVDAGRVGLTLTLMGVASSIGLAWISTKSPRFGVLVAQRRHEELQALFRRADLQALAVSGSAAALVTVVVALLPLRWPDLSGRFLDVLPLACIAASAVFNVYVSARAIYLRSFRREPLMTLSIVNGLAIALAAALAARAGGPSAVALAYFLVTASIALLWCRPVFRRCQLEYTKD